MITIEKNFVYLALPKTDSNTLGGHWMETRKEWRFPNNLNCLQEINRFYPDPQLPPIIERKKQQIHNMKSLKLMQDVTGNDSLRPYQRVDVEVLKKLPHPLIKSEMRTGKTPTALHVVETDFNIIVCPASILLYWKKEILKWLPLSEVHVANSTPKKRIELYKELQSDLPTLMKPVTFLIISYETLKQDLKLLIEFLRPLKRNKVTLGTMIVDEAHRLNSHDIDSSKAVYALGKHAQKRIAVTGTPSKDNGQEIYGIFHFLYPDKFPAYWAFVDRYWETVPSRFNAFAKDTIGFKRKKELLDMLEFMSVSRSRQEVMPWLPKTEHIQVDLEMSKKQRIAYDDVVDTFIYEENGELKVDAPSILAQITRLRQIALSPELLDIKAASVKEEYILDWVRDNSNEQVIIFSSFTSYLKMLAKKLEKLKFNVGMIHGEMSAKNKQLTADEFQAGRIDIILANIEAGGVGFTLDKAETVIFLDKHYNPTLNDQAQDRMIPTEESRNHTCTTITLVCKDSMDEKINDIIKRKQDIISIINKVGISILQDSTK